MNHFDYRNGVLHAEAVNLIELAEAAARRSIAIRQRRWNATTGFSPSLCRREDAGLLTP